MTAPSNANTSELGSHVEVCEHADHNSHPLVSMLRDADRRLSQREPDVRGARVSLHGARLGLSGHLMSRADVSKEAEALDRINAIRNSIIGCQKVNFSEHVYPLVAALGDAGYAGLEYAESRENVGTLIERTTAAEDRATAAEARADRLAEVEDCLNDRAEACLSIVATAGDDSSKARVAGKAQAYFHAAELVRATLQQEG